MLKLPIPAKKEIQMLRKVGKVKRITQDQGQRQAPPGQYITDKFPVLTHGPTPRIDLKVWSFRIYGLVEEERTLAWEEFVALPQIALTRDFHCVTQWSRLDNLWEGVPFREVAGLVMPKSEAQFVMVHSYGGYTTNLALDTAMEEDVLFAHRHDGKPLEAGHGGPMRPGGAQPIRMERVPSGSRGWSSWLRTAWAFGRSWATTTTATRGTRSGSGTDRGSGFTQAAQAKRLLANGRENG